MHKTKIPEEAIDLIISVLTTVPELHYRVCFEAIDGRPEFDCICPLKYTIYKLLELKRKQKEA